MRFTTKLSAFMTLLVVLAMCLVLLGSTISFFYLCQKKMEQRLQSIVTAYDQSLLLQPINKKREWLPLMMQTLGVVDVSVKNSTSTLYQLHIPAVLYALEQPQSLPSDGIASVASARDGDAFQLY